MVRVRAWLLRVGASVAGGVLAAAAMASLVGSASGWLRPRDVPDPGAVSQPQRPLPSLASSSLPPPRAAASPGASVPEPRRVTGRVLDAGGPEVGSASCDRAAIGCYVKRNLRAIQSCYERELKRDANLRGKVVIRFTIAATGRVQGLPEVEEDTLGSEAVICCVRNTIRMWMFPLKDHECPVAYPFVFAPAS